MLLPRIIPCLLINEDELIKTKQFKDSKYIGDPLMRLKYSMKKLMS